MQKTIERLAHDHEFDLTLASGRMRLEAGDAYMPLVVEKIKERLVSVTHYHESNGDLVTDPEIVFWVAPTDGRWYPISYEQGGMAFVRYVTLAEDGQTWLKANIGGQLSLGQFCDKWARNISSQFKNAARTA
jgi:hypothetical protein